MPNPLQFLPNALGQNQVQINYGEVVAPTPTSSADPLYVVLPDWSRDHPFPVTWPQDHGVTLPQAGAACLLIRDSRGFTRCVWWDGVFVSGGSSSPGGGTSVVVPPPTGVSATDSANIQAAINTCFGAGIAQQATIGGTVDLHAGLYVAEGIVLKGGVHLRGVGTGGQAFSDTDANLPPSGTFLKLKAGSSQDLIVTDNFATLNASPGSATAYNTPTRCGISDLVLDGNRFGGSSGRCLAVFAVGFDVQHVVFQNSAAANGVYVNGPTSSVGETELMMSRFRVTNCTGNGLNLQGDHDLIISHGVVSNSGGIGIVEGANLGTSLFSDVHIYSSGGYNWQLGCLNTSHTNCISDGSPGVQVLSSGISWIGGSIYGIRDQFDELISLGDGTSRRVQGCYFNTNLFQIGPGGRMFRYRANTTTGWNVFRSAGNLGDTPTLPHFADDGYGTASGAISSGATSITIATVTTAFSTGQIVVSDGTNATTATVSSITGGNVLNLSGTLGTAMSAGTNNVAVWNVAATPGDTYELQDTNGSTAGFYQTQSGPSGNTVIQMNDSLRMLGAINFADGNGHTKGAVYSSTGSPQGQVSGQIGDMCFRTDGGVGTFIYRCTGTTNWTAVV